MYGKENKRLFIYAAFDIYYFGGMQKDAHVRELPFMTNDESVLEDKTRLSLLHKFHQMLELQHVTKNSVCKFHMRVKHFESCGNHQTIFEACSRIWEKRDHFDYEIDGLIFTPMQFGVGGNKMYEANEINGKKFTWKHSFKWKPPTYNTIDFLVTTVKDKDGKDLVKHVVHENGNMMNEAIEYKTLMLMCGFDKKRDGFMNPFDDVLFDNIPKDNYGKNDDSWSLLLTTFSNCIGIELGPTKKGYGFLLSFHESPYIRIIYSCNAISCSSYEIGYGVP